MIYLIDMDVVVVNFEVALCRHLGQSEHDVRSRWKPGEWDMSHALGMTKADVEQTLTRAPETFWSEMEPYPEARAIYDLCRRLGSTHFVTAAWPSPESHAGKFRWLRRFTGDLMFNDYHMTYHKEKLANAEAVLLDDRDENVKKFRAAGGRAILYPRWWNSRHAEESHAFAVVRDELYALDGASHLKAMAIHGGLALDEDWD